MVGAKEYQDTAMRLDHPDYGYLVHKELLGMDQIVITFDVSTLIWC